MRPAGVGAADPSRTRPRTRTRLLALSLPGRAFARSLAPSAPSRAAHCPLGVPPPRRPRHRQVGEHGRSQRLFAFPSPGVPAPSCSNTGPG